MPLSHPITASSSRASAWDLVLSDEWPPLRPAHGRLLQVMDDLRLRVERVRSETHGLGVRAAGRRRADLLQTSGAEAHECLLEWEDVMRARHVRLAALLPPVRGRGGHAPLTKALSNGDLTKANDALRDLVEKYAHAADRDNSLTGPEMAVVACSIAVREDLAALIPRDPSPSVLPMLPRSLWSLTAGKAGEWGSGLSAFVGEVREAFGSSLGPDPTSPRELLHLYFPGRSEAIRVAARWLDEHGFFAQMFDTTLCRMRAEEITSADVALMLSGRRRGRGEDDDDELDNTATDSSKSEVP